MTSMQRVVPIVVLALVLSACGGAAGDPAGGSIRVYTSVTQDTVDAVVEAFGREYPDATVEVFRAPTGELTARIAAELREGGLRADVLWLTDPLSMQRYDADGLLASWRPTNLEAVPEAYRTETFFGTRLLNMVIVRGADVDPGPERWEDLADPAYRGRVAIPDPGFAGSAFAALAYFALGDGDLDYYRRLAENDVVEVRSPGEVVSGVADGRFAVGMSLAKIVRGAVGKGSPVTLVWPEPGAIAIYSPIAVVAERPGRATAEAFADFVLSVPAQEAIAATGWEPIRRDVDWPHRGPQVGVDWRAAFDRQEELLRENRAVGGG